MSVIGIYCSTVSDYAGVGKVTKVTGPSLLSVPVYGRAMIEIKCSNGRNQTMGKWTDVCM